MSVALILGDGTTGTFSQGHRGEVPISNQGMILVCRLTNGNQGCLLVLANFKKHRFHIRENISYSSIFPYIG